MRPLAHGLGIGLLGLLVIGCSSAPPAAPAPPTIETVGIVAEERVVDPQRDYVLQDGRHVRFSTVSTRLLFDGGPGQPLVAGSDATGEFVAVFVHQDGLPVGCHLPGIGQTGTERGAYVEIAGLLWRKSASFKAGGPVPPTGQAYGSSTRFCFDEAAEVTSTIP